MIGRSVLFLLLVLPATALAVNLSYPVVQVSPRALGMGGADQVMGEGLESLYANPAGLMGMYPGWQATPLAVSAGGSSRTRSFNRDVDNAQGKPTSRKRRNRLAEVFADYQGDHLHGDVTIQSMVGWRDGDWAMAIGWLGDLRFDGRSHQGFGDEGLLNVDARNLSGPFVGGAYRSGPLVAGASIKHLNIRRVRRSYSVRELVELTEQGRDILDDADSGSATAVDLGVHYQLQDRWQTRLGASIENFNHLDFGDAGRIPRTVNVGASFRPASLRHLRVRLNAEYIDLLGEHAQDGDYIKRTRFGAEGALLDHQAYAVVLRGGFYQGSITTGLEWRIYRVRMGIVTYAEELGAYAGQDRDRRYLLTIDAQL